MFKAKQVMITVRPCHCAACGKPLIWIKGWEHWDGTAYCFSAEEADHG